MDAFFKLDEDGNITFNEGVVYNIPVVKSIIRRDRGGVIKGDNDGRKKYLAKLELCYVWFLVNVNSPGVRDGLSGKDLSEKAISYLNLPDGWEPDELVDEFHKLYKEYHGGIVIKTIKQLIKSVKIISNTNDIILERLEEFTKGDDTSLDTIANINKAQEQLVSIADKVPDLVKKLNDANSEYNNQEEDFGKAMGNVDIVSSMIPGK